MPDKAELPAESAVYYPLLFIENKLGIELNMLGLLMKESQEQFVQTDEEDRVGMEQVTRVMILLKPDNYTALNKRKWLMTIGVVEPQTELDLISLIFTLPKHCKSGNAWYHRQWILTTYPSLIHYDLEHALCQSTAERHPRNYYAWTYRYWLLTQSMDQTRVRDEYEHTKTWIGLNISDYSGFHYLEHCMKLTSVDITSHMQWISNLIKMYPGHESLWCHRRYCSYLYIHTPNYCEQQHQFVQDVLMKESSHSDERTFALRFGLWQLMQEKRQLGHTHASSDIINQYMSVAPTPDIFGLNTLQ